MADSWQAIGTYPWHRNGCCAMAPRGQKSYCIWGEGPSPFPGLGISSTLNIDAGKFDTEAWSVAEGVDCLFHVNRTRASLCALPARAVCPHALPVA